MNYIREELLRQQTLWAALASAREDPAEEERMEEQLLGQGWERQGETRGNNGLTGTEAETWVGYSPQAVEKEPFVGTALPGSEAATVWDVKGRHRETELTEAGGQLIFAEGTVAEQFSMDVKRISRSIQRDARRYDGGFSMY